jgi:hypothetical protein
LRQALLIQLPLVAAVQELLHIQQKAAMVLLLFLAQYLLQAAVAVRQVVAHITSVLMAALAGAVVPLLPIFMFRLVALV